MAYKYGDYTLHKKMVTLKGNKKTYPLYYFCKKTPKSGQPCELPEGYEVFVNEKIECPLLKYSKGRVSGWQKKRKSRIR